jgi:hypothetical protein
MTKRPRTLQKRQLCTRAIDARIAIDILTRLVYWRNGRRTTVSDLRHTRCGCVDGNFLIVHDFVDTVLLASGRSASRNETGKVRRKSWELASSCSQILETVGLRINGVCRPLYTRLRAEAMGLDGRKTDKAKGITNATEIPHGESGAMSSRADSSAINAVATRDASRRY